MMIQSDLPEQTRAGSVRRHARISACGAAMSALTLIFFVVNARWIWLYRHGHLLDIDEAGYLGFALIDYQAFIRRGLVGWVSTVFGPGIQAPLTTALASLLFLGVGPHLIVGFAVPLLAGTGCIVATYFLGKSLGSPQAALAASVLVASCPEIVNYSRSFHFSIPATLVFTVMLLALVRSKHFEKVGWSLLFGVSLGLLPLTRTMTIAFVPGVVLGAFVYAVTGPVRRARRFLLLTACLAISLLTAATWYIPNGAAVLGYLTSFGYGARSVEYGKAISRFGPDAWLSSLSTFGAQVFLAHLILIISGAVALFAAAWRRAREMGSRAFVERAVRAPQMPILIVVAEIFVALTSTRTSGSAFFAPMVPASLVVATWALFNLSSERRFRRVLMGAISIAATMTSAPLLELRGPLAVKWGVDLPVLGGYPVADGDGTLQRYLSAMRPHQAAVGEDSTSRARAWMHLDVETAALVTREGRARASITFGFRHRLYNVNTVNLQQLRSTGRQFRTRQVEPVVTGDSVPGYLSWLTSEAAETCVLLTKNSTEGDFEPLVSPGLMRNAAEQAGFEPVAHLLTPDGQSITLWANRLAPPNCGSRRQKLPKLSFALISTHLVDTPGAGFVDVIHRIGQDLKIVGWAADPATKSPATAVYIFVNGSDVVAVAPTVSRPDINSFLNPDPRQLFGFTTNVPVSESIDSLRVFAQMHDGSFAELGGANGRRR